MNKDMGKLSLIPLILIMLLNSGPAVADEDASRGNGSSFLGAALGLPTFLGISIEIPGSSNVNLGVHAGSMIFAHSLGARVIIGSTDEGWKFRYYAGAVVIHEWYGEYYYEAKGTSLHGWAGVNLTLNRGNWRFIVDAGALIGGDPDKGFGWTGVNPVAGISLLHRL